MSDHRIIVALRNHHKRIWASLTPEQRRKALEAANGEGDRQSLDKAYKAARGN